MSLLSVRLERLTTSTDIVSMLSPFLLSLQKVLTDFILLESKGKLKYLSFFTILTVYQSD